jgi:hypothetical protein
MRAAPTSEETQSAIVRALLDGAGDHYAIAAELGEPPFRVRAELKALKRERLVTEIIRADLHHWRLTTSGQELAAKQNQLRLA